ncbi:unnamed protein product, partial [Polarella glacialis]
ALLAVDDSSEKDSVAPTGAHLVWRLGRRTRHPRLSEAFPEGLLLVTQRSPHLKDTPTGGTGSDEADAFLAPLPLPSGEEESLGSGCIVGGVEPLSSSGTAWEFGILEERLEPLSLWSGRQLLSEVSRQRIRLARPLLVAVQADSAAEECRGFGQDIAYLGVQTRWSGNDENEPPEANGVQLLETFQVLRPRLPRDATVADIFRTCRGRSRELAEVRMRARYDLLPVDSSPSSGSSSPWKAEDAESAWSSKLPAEMLPGAFISLMLTWPLSVQQALSWPLLQGPPGLSCSATVHVRGGRSAERCLLGQQWAHVDILRRLACLLSCGADDEAANSPLQGCQLQGSRSESTLNMLSTRAAVARLFEVERDLATSSAGLRHSSCALAPEAPSSQLEEDRPNRDFVDRLWLNVLSRCESAREATLALQVVLEELGRPGSSFAPFVRRDNPTTMAELVRTAVQIATLRRYASPGEAQELSEAVLAWEDRCKDLVQLRNALLVIVGIGTECVRRDLVHLVTRRGYVTAQELGGFQVGASPVAEIEGLCCLRQIAELAVLCV